jgi:hypothetical protein
MLKWLSTKPISTHLANILVSMYPIRIIDGGTKIEKDLAKNQLRLIAGTDCGDNCIHVDA